MYTGGMVNSILKLEVKTLITMRRHTREVQRSLNDSVELVMDSPEEFRTLRETKDTMEFLADTLDTMINSVQVVGRGLRRTLRFTPFLRKSTRLTLKKFALSPMSESPELSDSALRELVGLGNE